MQEQQVELPTTEEVEEKIAEMSRPRRRALERQAKKTYWLRRPNLIRPHIWKIKGKYPSEN